MEARILKQTDDLLLVEWQEGESGFGQLSMKWDSEQQRHIIDSECMGIQFIIDVFKNLKTK